LRSPLARAKSVSDAKELAKRRFAFQAEVQAS